MCTIIYLTVLLSIPDISKDEGYATFPNSPRKPGRPGDYLEKTYIPEKSISNVDLTDTEQNSLDDAFGRMHDKVHSLGTSNELVYGHSCPQSLQHQVAASQAPLYSRSFGMLLRFFGILPAITEPTSH